MTGVWESQLLPGLNSVPDVSGLRCTAIIHANGDLYLERFHVVDTPHCCVRIHHWHASDDRQDRLYGPVAVRGCHLPAGRA